MKATHELKSVKTLLNWRRNHMLAPNPEYQRGAVWQVPQKKRLLDSVLRGYPLPLIYLHHIRTEVDGAQRDDFEVIDGQQRINALSDFMENAFRLFDPVADRHEAQFPSFITEQPCPWGGKSFEDLEPELQTQFLETKLSVMMVETDVPNEARDLFIRLQAGMPLNSQEKRDAWPGKFTEFVLKLAGKPELARYPGQPFFKIVMKATEKNRGEFRQLAAQIAMLYLTRRDTGRLCEISGDAIDTFYHKHLDFDATQPHVKRLADILETLKVLLGDGKRKKVVKHEAISLVLLVDVLMDDYTKSWTTHFASAFDEFRANVVKGAATRYKDNQDEFWIRYGQLTRANTDRAELIERRHYFFVLKMHDKITPQPKDSTRIFGSLEKELIYSRDKKRCQRPNCGSEVAWAAAEFHHIESHAAGGATSINNGALVHKSCHPKSAADVVAFAAHWKSVRNKEEASPAEEIAALIKATPPEKRNPTSKAEGRGRPKITPEEKFVKDAVKRGLTTKAAYEILDQVSKIEPW